MKDYEKMTVKELIEELTNLGVTFNKKARKAELIELLQSAAGAKSAAEPEPAAAPAKGPAPKKRSAKAKTQGATEVVSGYAIVRTGGKQYQVATGKLVRVEKIDGNVGDTVELQDVLVVSDGANITVGQPTVAGAVVTARIVEQDKAKKVLVFKKKRRKGYRVKRGHRQMYTALEISAISV